MAYNFIDIPFLNPVRYAPRAPQAYKRRDNSLFVAQIRNFEQKTTYSQKWVDGDIITQQFRSNIGPVQVELIECGGRSVQTYAATAVPTSLINPGFTVYEVNIPVTGLSTMKFYQLILRAGFDESLIEFESEPQQVLPSDMNTILFQYWHSSNKEDVVFDTSIKYNRRLEAFITDEQPKSVRTVWVDQPHNTQLLSGIPYLEATLVLGSATGVPWYEADFTNRVFCCDSVFGNGEQYTAVDGSEMEANREENYPMAGWKMAVNITKNRSSMRGSNDNTLADNFFVVSNIDTQVFGTFNGNASSNIIQIIEAE